MKNKSFKRNDPNIGLFGRYKFVKHKADADGNIIDGTAETVLPWFDNLITNSGLNLLGGMTGGRVNAWCRLGTGSATPTNADTGLAAQVGSSSTIQAATSGWSGTTFGWRKTTYRFAAGSVSGVNLAEVAVAPASTGGIFSRALLKDTGGIPTTITLAADEVLDVVYELRLYPSPTPVVSTVTIDGVSTTVTVTPLGIGSSSWFPDDIGLGSPLMVGNLTNSGYPVYRALENYTTTVPTNSSMMGTRAYQTYVADSYQRTMEISFDLNTANFTTGIGCFQFGRGNTAAAGYGDSNWHAGIGIFGVEFSPKIQKTSAKTGKIKVGVSWGRYTP